MENVNKSKNSIQIEIEKIGIPEAGIIEIMSQHGDFATHREFRVGFYDYGWGRILQIVETTEKSLTYSFHRIDRLELCMLAGKRLKSLHFV